MIADALCQWVGDCNGDGEELRARVDRMLGMYRMSGTNAAEARHYHLALTRAEVISSAMFDCEDLPGLERVNAVNVALAEHNMSALTEEEVAHRFGT